MGEGAGSDTSTVGFFIRVDIGVAGERSPDDNSALCERLATLLQNAILERADGGPELDLQAMTYIALGPLALDQTLNESMPQQLWEPLTTWLADDPDA